MHIVLVILHLFWISNYLLVDVFDPAYGCMVLNCLNLKEISLEFSSQENDTTDLVTLVDGMGRSCPRLQNIHIASVRLSQTDVLSLTTANLRGLRMLSLVLGSEITDASVAAIASSYSRLELLDLSEIQFATVQLPLLELMDCGMTISDLDSQNSPSEESGDNEPPNALNRKLHLMYQKLILKHSRLKKLNLWGCFGLDVRSLSP
ncbi:hypothetical protein V6N13_020463 [Hibiscus sabdariffa]|uniref:Uncharacterized protein n=1 Tax=Hibiscus sabdariffa TaxID=183260 RepID=A0ABR2ETI0_9ROSI